MPVIYESKRKRGRGRNQWTFDEDKTMGEQDRLGFIAALGEEFCTVLDPVVGSEICPQDGYEVFAKFLGKDFGPEVLRRLNDSQIEQLRAFACTSLESPKITGNHMKEVVRRTLFRW
jgi:hypothetical protein